MFPCLCDWEGIEETARLHPSQAFMNPAVQTIVILPESVFFLAPSAPKCQNGQNIDKIP